MNSHTHADLEETVRRYEIVDLKKDMDKGFKDVNSFMADSKLDNKEILNILSKIQVNMTIFATKDEVVQQIKDSQKFILEEVKTSSEAEDKKTSKELAIARLKLYGPTIVQLLVLAGTIFTVVWGK